jgi:lysylphosphatidylglycerol synthetase-like protein (DUF2156 family)
MRHPISGDDRRQGHGEARAARIAVNVQGTLTRIVGAVVAYVVVAVVVVVTIMAMTVMAMVPMVMAALIAVVHVAMIAIRVGVHEKVRRHTSGRTMGHTDDGRQREQHRHRPDQGNAASARSLQARQHAVH